MQPYAKELLSRRLEDDFFHLEKLSQEYREIRYAMKEKEEKIKENFKRFESLVEDLGAREGNLVKIQGAIVIENLTLEDLLK